MNVITMLFVIPIVADLMFPKARLPNGLCPFALLGRRESSFIFVQTIAGKMSFYHVPAH